MLTTSVFRGVIGSFASGWFGDKIGKKLMITIAYVLILVGISVEMVATTNPVFFGAKFTIGFAIGTSLTVSFSYVGEIAPPRLRGIPNWCSGKHFLHCGAVDSSYYSERRLGSRG